ncbi:MAG TPA: FHA domain-containing protein [Planctomycetes bacterium]|nr:FHA domain-containing protein [Planctomycetota bacterium]
MAVLKVIRGLSPGRCFPLEKACSVLGRHPDCDIVLPVGAVSRQHAQILRIDNQYYLEDLKSRNGTFVNEEFVRGRRRLSEHDVVRICDLEFKFLYDPAADEDSSTVSHVRIVDDEPSAGTSTIVSKLDISAGREGLRLTANAEAKLKALLEIAQNLGGAVTLEDVLPKVLDSLFKIFIQADRGFIVLKDFQSGRLIPMAVKHRHDAAAEQIRISRTIVNEAMESKGAILSADAATDERFGMSESIADFQIRSVMCAPLIGSEGQVLGVIQIDTIDPRRRFNNDDLEVLGSVACQAAVSVENAQLHRIAVAEEAMKRELEVAYQVQQGFLPAEPPVVPGYEFFDFYEPARQLGGDYFDYIPLQDGRVAVALGDVSGKGVSASLLMAKLSAEMKYLLASETSATDAVAKLNRVFCDSRWDDRFITLILTVLDPRSHGVTVVNAGHMFPLLRTRSGKVEEVAKASDGMPLGVMEEEEYQADTVQLSPGDCLVLYSDGITEAMNSANECYGDERLQTQLAKPADSVTAVGKGLLEDVRQFVGTRAQSDDRCVVCFGRKA